MPCIRPWLLTERSKKGSGVEGLRGARKASEYKIDGKGASDSKDKTDGHGN